MQSQHLLVNTEGCRFTCHSSIEITNVTSGFFDVARRAIGVNYAMARDDRSRMQSFDLIEGEEPLAPGFFVGFGEIGVRVVVDSISRDNQADRRHMQRGGVGGVGMTEGYYIQPLALEIQGVSFEDLRQHKLRRNLARKARFPEGSYKVGAYLVLHGRNSGK
jgi:hypothetical protein